ncbi:hypothetical protein SUGI_0327380 [Cryptomeria japonica]|nr:hypothetical protein SUGI_0327380 [Cryptomeria japonica]
MFCKIANSSALTPIGDGDSGSLGGERPDKEGVKNFGHVIPPGLSNALPGKDGFKSFGHAIPLGLSNGAQDTNFNFANPNSRCFLDSSFVSFGAGNYLQVVQHGFGVSVARSPPAHRLRRFSDCGIGISTFGSNVVPLPPPFGNFRCI